MIKVMLETNRYNDQDILAHFTRPTRSINHREVGEIRNGTRHRSVRAATPDQLTAFLSSWPDHDPETGLRVPGDELLIKAREAMIAAVHTFNGAGLTFRTEIFITTAMIAWTYLLHEWFRREQIDYRYRQGGEIKKTKNNADIYWDLGKCLRHDRSPLSEGTRHNLEFLLEIRHEIEHRFTNRIDEALGAKLQACCINFNSAICELFGEGFGLEKRLPLALQFVTFDVRHQLVLKAGHELPQNLETMIDHFHERLTDAQQSDPAFAYRVAFVPKVGGKASRSDAALKFVKPDTEEAKEISRILLKEVDKRRYTATEIVREMQADGYDRFNQTAHTKLWQALDAKRADKGFGRPGDYDRTWVWFDTWLARVRAHCQENAERYAP
ncbi:Protein of unknown function [Faunimonas pinastri]|uniref:DUF3644 domain-containing protein n=1 Tax=Faunimonas pinastri TaxID=1855383 RepID=A0A1H9A9G7_9HYPH|nr:DUF3644 domain-containing protein [Faunimonas pinastri]SEP73300.1 Protein of unknown function [Faunimonas pinastri]